MSTQSETSLKSYLRERYGVQTQKAVSTLGKELQRSARFSNHHHFNLRCYKTGIVPVSLRIKAPVNTRRAKEAAERASRVFVQERIKTSLRARNSAIAAQEKCRKLLQEELSEIDFKKVTSLCVRTAEKVFEKVKERQTKKFTALRERFLKVSDTSTEEESLRPSWVINLSKKNLTETEQRVLSKGPGFATVPKFSTIDIAAPIEAGLQLSSESPLAIETARIKICDVLNRAKQSRPKTNFSRSEKEAYKQLRNDEDIQIVQADKGNATVVMDSEDYDKKARELLDDKQAYCVLKKDPTRQTERNLLHVLRDLKKNKRINESCYNRVKPSEGSSKPAQFYGRLKIHKVDMPLRPVVSTIGSSTYALSKRLSSILRPLVGTSGRILQNTHDLVESMENIELQEDELMVSYDVKSLFTSIPVEETILICERKLKQDPTLEDRSGGMDVETIVKLLRFCLTTTSFQYKGDHYKQLDGVAMGSPVSPAVADIFMEDLEEKFLSTFSNSPRFWKRFVDDIISVIKRKDKEEFLEHLNRQHSRIRFTVEEENDGSLPFLDVLFQRQQDGHVTRTVYQKPTHTNRYVQFDSHHPAPVKAGIVQGLAERALRVCSSTEEQNMELERIVSVMGRNGYPRRFVEMAISKQRRRKALRGVERINTERNQEHMPTVKIPYIEGVSQEVRRLARAGGVRCAFYTPSTLRDLYQAKDKLPYDTKTHSVYSVKCKTCGEEYIGETQRALCVRMKEHRDAIRLGHCSKSAIAEHVHQQSSPHEIDWSTMRVIDGAKWTKERKIRESFHIQTRAAKINRDTGVERSMVWNGAL